jgi:peptidoglycan/LPS O-acetylase OafA/YrhL
VAKKLGSTRWGMFTMWLLSLAASVAFIVLRSKGSVLLVVWGNNLPDALPLMPYFFFGSVFSFPQFKKLLNLQLATLLMIVGIFALSNVWTSVLTAQIFGELVVSLILPYFVLSLALTERPIFSKWFEHSDFAYGLYLYGFPVQQAMYQLLPKGKLSSFAMALVCFAVTLLFAILSWYFVEKPMQRLGQAWIRRIKSKPARDAA